MKHMKNNAGAIKSAGRYFTGLKSRTNITSITASIAPELNFMNIDSAHNSEAMKKNLNLPDRRHNDNRHNIMYVFIYSIFGLPDTQLPR